MKISFSKGVSLGKETTLKDDLMSNGGLPLLNKLKCIFGESLSHNLVARHIFQPHRSFAYILWLLFFILVNFYVCECVYLYFSICFSSFFFCLFCPFQICLFLTLFYYSLDTCLLSKESQKEGGSRWKEGWEGNRGSWGRENHNQNKFHVKRIEYLFSIKRNH